MALDARVSDNHFYLHGVAYFRSHAEGVRKRIAGWDDDPWSRKGAV